MRDYLGQQRDIVFRAAVAEMRGYLGPKCKKDKIMKIKITKTEIKILNLFIQGLSDKQIGIAIGISANTVRVHLANIRRKTGKHKAVLLALWWSENQKEITK